MRRAIELAYRDHVRELLRPKPRREVEVAPARRERVWVEALGEWEDPFPSLSAEGRRRLFALTGRSPEESYVLFLSGAARRRRVSARRAA